MPARAGAYALEWLQQQGVEVLLGHRVIDTDWDEVSGLSVLVLALLVSKTAIYAVHGALLRLAVVTLQLRCGCRHICLISTLSHARCLMSMCACFF